MVVKLYTQSSARMHARTSGETKCEVTNVFEGSKKPAEGTPQAS